MLEKDFLGMNVKTAVGTDKNGKVIYKHGTVLAAWTSKSQEGLKVLVGLPTRFVIKDIVHIRPVEVK